ncbi:MAG: hypothetical protein JNN07_14930 [Verrucomicrobiales bacterium]|nr:hypothetical protein [Verrucomicrobiales bacterium]
MSDRLRLLFRSLEEQEVAGSAFKRATVGQSLIESGFLAGEIDAKVAVLKRDDRFENEGSESLRRRLFVRPGESDAALFERGLNKMLEAWELPYPARGRVFAALRTVVPMQTNSPLVFGDYVVSSTAGILLREARCLASLRMLELALALDQFAAGADGTFPSSLDQMVPKHFAATPVDPFSASNFVYQCGPDQRSYTLRSSGAFDSVVTLPADSRPDGIAFSVVKRRPGIKRGGAEAQ